MYISYTIWSRTYIAVAIWPQSATRLLYAAFSPAILLYRLHWGFHDVLFSHAPRRSSEIDIHSFSALPAAYCLQHSTPLIVHFMLELPAPHPALCLFQREANNHIPLLTDEMVNENHCTRPYLIDGNERKDKADHAEVGRPPDGKRMLRFRPAPNRFRIFIRYPIRPWIAPTIAS